MRDLATPRSPPLPLGLRLLAGDAFGIAWTRGSMTTGFSADRSRSSSVSPSCLSGAATAGGRGEGAAPADLEGAGGVISAWAAASGDSGRWFADFGPWRPRVPSGP